MNNYLIDSDVLVEYLRGNKSLVEQILDSNISVITYGEVLYGEYKFVRGSNAFEFVSDFVHNFNITIIDINKDIVNKFVEIKVGLEKSGKKLEDFDIFIVATALEHGLTLVTNNKKHFSRVENIQVLDV